MNARTLLADVGARYRDLTTLAIECLVISESGDEGNMSRSEQRARALYAAPRSVRIEQGGRRGSVMVTDGRVIHHYFGGPPRGRYTKTQAAGAEIPAGVFRPEFPVSNNVTILFDHIADGVQEANVLREADLPAALDTPCYVVAVRYERRASPMLVNSDAPVTFWID